MRTRPTAVNFGSLIAAVWLVSAAATANAAVIYTDRTAWETAVLALGGQIMIDTFSNPITDANSITLDSGIESTVNPSLVIFGLNNVDVSAAGEYVGRVGSPINNHPPTITWQFPATVFAFFGDFDRLSGLTVTGDFDGTGDTTISVLDTIGGIGSFGIIGAAAIASLSWGTSNNSEFFAIDDFSFAKIASVPEPGTLALFGLGLAGLCFVRRRRVA